MIITWPINKTTKKEVNCLNINGNKGSFIK